MLEFLYIERGLVARATLENEKVTGAEIPPAIVSGIVTGKAPVCYWLIFFPVSSNSPRSLCDG